MSQLEIIEEEELMALCDEQDQILEIALREIARYNGPSLIHVEVDEISPVTTEEPEVYGSLTLKSYATGNHPSLEDVIKENNRPSSNYGGYGSWDREDWKRERESQQKPWANRFDNDDNVCRDPYAYYSGDWY